MTHSTYLAAIAILLTTTWVSYQLGVDRGWTKGYERGWDEAREKDILED